MSSVYITYTQIAKDIIQHLHPSLKPGLRIAIEELADNPWLGKPLQKELSGYRSHRFRQYRTIYKYDEKSKKIIILFAGKRVDVYKKFAEYLKQATT